MVQGTCMALHQFATHLIDEFENKFESETINDLFGGGFELVAYHGGQFHKISDVVYVYAEERSTPIAYFRSTFQNSCSSLPILVMISKSGAWKFTTMRMRIITQPKMTGRSPLPRHPLP